MQSPTNWQQAVRRAAPKGIEKSRVSEGTASYADYLFIQDKSDRLIHYVPNKVQTHFRANRTGRDLVLKARQEGVSTEIQADNFLASITERVRSATLAHDDSGTQFLRRMADRFWSNLPDEIRPERGLDNATTTTYPTTGSEVFIATAGSKNKGRAGTYRRVHGSEVAFWTDAQSVMAGLIQGVPDDGQIVLESTPNGAQGVFYTLCMEALRGGGRWKLHFYPWWWDNGYQLPLIEGETLEPYTNDELALIVKHSLAPEQIKWRRSKQHDLPATFIQEYPEDPITCFLTSGRSVFGDFAHALYTPTEFGPVPGHYYTGAVDWAQESDFTVLSIWDADENREVFLLSMNKMRWGDMRRQIRIECQRWGVQQLVVEKNSASSNIEDLENEFAAENVACQIQAFTMTNQRKANLVVNLHNCIHEEGGQLLDEPVANDEMRNFVSTQTALGIWTYAAAGTGHDDIPIARMLGHYACSQRIPEKW